MVFKIIKESGKEYANVEIGFNSRTENATILYAKTITPEGKLIPLKENAIKIVTPYEGFPSYSDYKNLTFSMPGVTVGSIVDFSRLRCLRVFWASDVSSQNPGSLESPSNFAISDWTRATSKMPSQRFEG